MRDLHGLPLRVIAILLQDTGGEKSVDQEVSASVLLPRAPELQNSFGVKVEHPSGEDPQRRVVWDAVRIYEGEKNVQDTGGEKSVDQEVSASVLLPRAPELQNSFGVKVEHPSGDNPQGRVVWDAVRIYEGEKNVQEPRGEKSVDQEVSASVLLPRAPELQNSFGVKIEHPSGEDPQRRVVWDAVRIYEGEKNVQEPRGEKSVDQEVSASVLLPRAPELQNSFGVKIEHPSGEDPQRRVVWDAVRIYEGEKNVQEPRGEKSVDQEVSASVLLPRAPELQNSFGVKIEHPSGDNPQGRVVWDAVRIYEGEKNVQEPRGEKSVDQEVSASVLLPRAPELQNNLHPSGEDPQRRVVWDAVRIYEGEKNVQDTGEEKSVDQEVSASVLLPRAPELQNSFGVKVEHPSGEDPQRRVVWDAVRIYEGEKNVQGTGGEKSVDQESSASVLLPRAPELQNSFGVKVEHPSGDNPQGRVVHQREHLAFGSQPSVDQHEFQPSLTIHGGEWKGLSRFTDHQDLGPDLSQHQLLGQVLQGLGQVNQILGKNHQGIEQVNQIFGEDQQGYKKQYSFKNGDDRETYSLGVDKKLEEHTNLLDVNGEVRFEKATGGVINKLVKNKDLTRHDLTSGFKPLEEPNLTNLPKPLETIEVNNGVKKITFTKEVPVPYTVEVEKKVPFKVEVPVDRPYPVERPKPYPVYVEKKVPYKVREYISQPYTVYKRVPYTVKVHVSKPYPVHVPKPYRVLVEKKIPYQVEKHVPYPVRVYVDKPFPVHVPVFRPMPYTVERKVPLPVQVPVEKPYPVPVPKPYPVYVDKTVPSSSNVPAYRQPQVEESGQPVNVDQVDTPEFQTRHEPLQWREDVPYPAQSPMYHSQDVEGTTDQDASVELQRYHQHPQQRDYAPYFVHAHTPTYHQHELQDLEVQRHHPSQWRRQAQRYS